MVKIIQVYQTNPFVEGQGGGVRYVRNLLNGIKGSVNKILFLGIETNSIEDNIESIAITKTMTGYLRFLAKLMTKLPTLDTSKYDLVHVHRLYFAIPFILFKPKMKIVCSLHGRTFSVFESNNGALKLKVVKPIFMFIEKFCIRRIDYLVPVSQDVINSFESKYIGFSKRTNMSIVGSMLSLENFVIQDSNYLQEKFGNDNKYILFIGRLADVKDINFLITLWSEKFQDLPKYKLIIAGAGENEIQYKNLSSKICNKNHPIFLGEIKSNDIPKVISSSSMTILCSKHEASPTVVKESLSSGIPMITNRIGDVEDFIIDSKNGFIVEKKSDLYYKKILKLIDLKLKKHEVLEQSESKLKKCSIEYISNEYLNIYKKVINEK